MLKRIKKMALKLWRLPLCNRMRRGLTSRRFVILSSNCIGGCLLHDLGCRFDTPTINMVIPEFVTFCENWQQLLQLAPIPCPEEDCAFPVFQLGPVQLRGVHYPSDEAFLADWNRRAKRMLQKVEEGAEILLFAADTQLLAENAVERFEKLPYRKVVFSANALPCENCVIIPEFAGQPHVGDMTRYGDSQGRRLFEKYFNCVEFINGG